MGEEDIPSRAALKDLNDMKNIFVCRAFVLYIRIVLRIAIKLNNVSI